MEEYEENPQTYQLNQDNHEYILTTGIINDSVRVTCQENISLTGPYYSADFNMSELSSINKYFLLVESIYDAQTEINKAVERQKVGVQLEGQVLNVIIYLTIGTDRTNVTLPLAKSDNVVRRVNPIEEEPLYIGKLNLENKGNYPRDEQRICKLENSSVNIKNAQGDMNKLILGLIEKTKFLINEANLLKEDNAKLNERIKIIKEDNVIRKNELIKLIKEDRNLRDEYKKIKYANRKLEDRVNKKKELQIRAMKENSKNKNNYNNDALDGPIARTSKFEQPQIKTFVPRPTIKPGGQSYANDNNNVQEKDPFKPFTIKHV